MLLGELWERLGCSGDKDLESAFIQEVSVLAEENAWRLVLVVEQPVPAARLNSIGQQIADQIEYLNRVQVAAQPKDPASCLSAIVSKDWSQIIAGFDEPDRALIGEADYRIEHDHLVLMFKDFSSWHQALNGRSCGPD